jgi:hypothetical protein
MSFSYARNENSSFVPYEARPYLVQAGKEKEERKERLMKTYRTLTPAELYSLELSARRLRNEELGRLLRQGALAVKAAFERAVAQLSAKGVRHA